MSINETSIPPFHLKTPEFSSTEESSPITKPSQAALAHLAKDLSPRSMGNKPPLPPRETVNSKKRAFRRTTTKFGPSNLEDKTKKSLSQSAQHIRESSLRLSPEGSRKELSNLPPLTSTSPREVSLLTIKTLCRIAEKLTKDEIS